MRQRIFCLVVCIYPYFISAEIVFKICFWASLGYLSVPKHLLLLPSKQVLLSICESLLKDS
jgi:hypothetical protein